MRPPKDADGATAATPPPLPQPGPASRSAYGTRWVYWVGGLTWRPDGFYHGRLFESTPDLLGPSFALLAARSRCTSLQQANGSPTARRALPRSKRCRSPISPAISHRRRRPAVAVATSTLPTRLITYFWRPRTASHSLGHMVALAALGRGAVARPSASRGLCIADAFVTPRLVSFGVDPTSGRCIYLPLAIVT